MFSLAPIEVVHTDPSRKLRVHCKSHHNCKAYNWNLCECLVDIAAAVGTATTCSYAAIRLNFGPAPHLSKTLSVQIRDMASLWTLPLVKNDSADLTSLYSSPTF